MTTWLLLLALHFAPAQKIPGWEETERQRHTRYEQIAYDIQWAIEEHGSFYGFTKADSAALMLAVGVGETGLAPDADLGPCYRGGEWERRCDSGRSVGILQTMVLPREDQEDYFDNRRLHLQLAHRLLRSSLYGCRHLAKPKRLAQYGAGTCKSEAGQRGSETRMALYSSLIRKRHAAKSKTQAEGDTPGHRHHQPLPYRLRPHWGFTGGFRRGHALCGG